MKPSVDLFELINSLKKGEKAYFKKYASFHTLGEKNNYLRLFEVIEKQKKYDENALFTHFKGEPMLNNFSVAKAYLYDLILESLEDFHRNKSIGSQIRSLIYRAEILYEKNLFKQCEVLISKAEKIAGKYDRTIFQLELARWKNKLMIANSYSGLKEKELRAPFDLIDKITDRYKNYNFYFRAYETMFYHHLQSDVRKATDISLFEKYIKHPMFSDERKALSYEAKNCFYFAQLVYFYSKEDFKRVHFYTLKLLKLIEDNPHQLKADVAKYLNNIFNLMVCLHKLNRYGELSDTIEKLRTIDAGSDRLNGMREHAITNFQLIIYIQHGEFDKAVKLIKNREKITDAAAQTPNQFVSDFLYVAAVSYFGSGDLSNAKKYTNKILNDKAVDESTPLYCFIKIFNLLISFEQGDELLLEYQVRSTYHFLAKRKRLYKFENLVLDLIRKKLPRIKTRNELILTFKEMRKQILILSKDPYERNALEFFDIVSWLESKIENRKFGEVVRGKLK